MISLAGLGLKLEQKINYYSFLFLCLHNQTNAYEITCLVATESCLPMQIFKLQKLVVE